VDHRPRRWETHSSPSSATSQKIVLGQQATEEKSNEITAIPLLFKSLDIKGAIVTIDAMGTRTRIAQAIRDGGGDYVLSLKKNWPATERETRYWAGDTILCVFNATERGDARTGRARALGDREPLTFGSGCGLFRADLARLRSGNASANMAIVRHTALNLLSGARPTTSFKSRRKKAGWNVDYLETVLRRTAGPFKRFACQQPPR
jgi:predicted transposase YbfD/YdcC